MPDAPQQNGAQSAATPPVSQPATQLPTEPTTVVAPVQQSVTTPPSTSSAAQPLTASSVISALATVAANIKAGPDGVPTGSLPPPSPAATQLAPTQPAAVIAATPTTVMQPATTTSTATESAKAMNLNASGVPTGIPTNPDAAKKTDSTKKKGFLDSLKDQWAAHVEKNKAKAQTQVVGEQAGQKISAALAEGQLTAQEKAEIVTAEKVFQEGLSSIRDLIAPSSMQIDFNGIKLSGMHAKSLVIFTYPRYLDSNWMNPLINFDATMDIAQFVYPIDSGAIMKVLKRKVAQMQSSLRIDQEKGNVRDPALETALQDAEELRTQLQRGQEKFFQFGMYMTIYARSEKALKKATKQVESLLGGKLILTRETSLQTEQAFNSTLPLCLDELEVMRNMNTGPLSTTFPFSSSTLTGNDGILYGLNRHNDSLIIFDRFSLENANSVVFAKSGAGKSYAVKLEILRSLMIGTDVIIIDPENEYENLTQTVGGTYLRVSLTSDRRINPFDIPKPLKDEDVQPGDLLRANIITLQGLLKVMLGDITPVEESIMDKALIDVYAIHGITMDTVDPQEKTPPTMEDLESVLGSMDGGQTLAQRIQKFTTGTYGGIFNKPTNVDLSSGLMVFCIRDLEDALRPIAMYIILNYIWTRVRSELKRRLLIIDEAWSVMQHEDSAKFLFGLVKRARKYYLGVTTITQDVDDFVNNGYGKPIITNSSMQLLLKQAPSSIEPLTKIFNLTEGEKYMLLNSGVGQGLFFAGLKHVAIQIIASFGEDKLVTTNPEEVLKKQKEGGI